MYVTYVTYVTHLLLSLVPSFSKFLTEYWLLSPYHCWAFVLKERISSWVFHGPFLLSAIRVSLLSYVLSIISREASPKHQNIGPKIQIRTTLMLTTSVSQDFHGVTYNVKITTFIWSTRLGSANCWGTSVLTRKLAQKLSTSTRTVSIQKKVHIATDQNYNCFIFTRFYQLVLAVEQLMQLQ